MNKVELDSEAKISAALSKAVNQEGLTPDDEKFLDDETVAGMEANKTTYPEAINNRNAGQAAQATSVNLATAKGTETEIMCIEFFNELNGHINVKDNLPAVRKFFGLNLITGNLPDMNTEAKLIAVCETIKDGNAEMLAAGGNVMNSAFTAARVLTMQADYQALLDDKDLKKIALAALEKIVTDKSVIVKALCDSIAVQSEFHYRALEAGARRDACRNWGVNYETTKPITPISLLVYLPDGKTAASSAEARIGEYLTKAGKISKEGVKGIVNIQAELKLETTTEGDTFVIVRLLGYADSITAITIVAEKAQALTIILVAGVSSL